MIKIKATTPLQKFLLIFKIVTFYMKHPVSADLALFFPSTAFLRSKKAKGWLGMVGSWGQG
jgi:hypothetical protein